MAKDITLRRVVEGVVEKKLISDEGETYFLVTLRTKAYEQGHKNWLKKKFDEWEKGVKKEPDLWVESVRINLAAKKGADGSIEIRMKILGSLDFTPTGNIAFMQNVVSTLRKTLAEIVLSCYPPKFDYENPLFDALHLHTYIFTPGWDVDEKDRVDRINKLAANPIILGGTLGRCGVMPRGVEYDRHNDLISVSLRWKQHATETERDTLEKVLRAYFAGLGIDCLNLKIEPQ